MIRRALALLVKIGFLEKLNLTDGSEQQLIAVCFQSKEYRYVNHQEWAGENPGQCYESVALPWSDLGGDPLAKKLWNASRGETRWYPNQLACLRKAWPADEQIEQEWKAYLEQLERPCVYRGQWKSAQGKFLRKAKESQAESNVGTLAPA